MSTPNEKNGRSGFTLVELMVAVTILSFGLLAMAGMSVTVTKQFRGGSGQSLAALVAQSRIDSLSSLSCEKLPATGSISGTATTRGITERWSVRDGNDVKLIVDSVRTPYRKNVLVYTSIIPCRD
ncbi:MAG: type IV pilus modification PilV family protein [Gemmatimonadaceae bacterium]